MRNLIKVALRQQALFLPEAEKVTADEETRNDSLLLVSNLAKLGYAVSEDLFRALHGLSRAYKHVLYEELCEIKGVSKNWTPLVKGWDVPTGERRLDHFITLFANVFKWDSGKTLPCGHIIPASTFPLERYNGCPFCGKPFEFEKLGLKEQGSGKTVLELWTETDAQAFLVDLLRAKTAPDATQKESLSALLKAFGMPVVQVTMKETAVLVIDYFVESGEGEKAGQFFLTPTDILRYLWFKHTGFMQIVEPKTIRKRHKKNNSGWNVIQSEAGKNIDKSEVELKLKYSRTQARVVAGWLSNLDLPVAKICEIMHPKRGIWVRMIRALRLAEFSKNPGFEKLREILDEFYNERYDVWQGVVDTNRQQFNEADTLALLKERPGVFARSLFANMLWFGPGKVIAAFMEVIDKVPARLVFTLNAYAESYFEKNGSRLVKPLGGYAKTVKNHKLLDRYTKEELAGMQELITGLYLAAMSYRFKNQDTKSRTIFIDESLYKIPVSIGDRSETVQDIPSALAGVSYPVQGGTVRLFMQWGAGLKAQHLDMDLSARIAFENGSAAICSFSNLVTTGCKHSGDIRYIPEQVGTAEYIDIDLDTLEKEKARYVLFVCNAYSMGSLSPNMVVGWMDSKYPMEISESGGVAYDPSCVQHQVRITQGLSKGLIFGVLKVQTREIIWLEMSFAGQLAQGASIEHVELMLSKLSSKLNVGALLKLKAEAQELEIIDQPVADENYTLEWVRNTAAVTSLLID